ncbi:MAG: hypothetical protein ACD_78C00065G0011 [uncultured bacterium (gcode 4)]|uniref:Uncharacterized protein n=1 Tax=uncultured bacterium (gcode 4) TaxID=1234023 RepID=K1XZM0_9BACT|nr:MAG: hypothetical protein ACD_78C00065G0011 [uncultured bacterium (gcode 4)]
MTILLGISRCIICVLKGKSNFCFENLFDKKIFFLIMRGNLIHKLPHMNILNTQNSENMLTPAQFLEWFLSPKTIEGRYITKELNEEMIKQTLNLKIFFTEDDTRRLFECVDPKDCLYIIAGIIHRIQWEQSLAYSRKNGVSQIIEEVLSGK